VRIVRIVRIHRKIELFVVRIGCVGERLGLAEKVEKL
jgi:hypothetical protein